MMERRLTDLPKDVLANTLSFLDLPSLLNFSVVCKKGALLFKEESLWRLLCLRNLGSEEERDSKSWQEKYRNSLFRWRNYGKNGTISQDGKRFFSSSKGVSLCKTSKPLSKDKIHKCEFV